MELLIAIFVAIIIFSVLFNLRLEKRSKKKPRYKYIKKESVMTKTEQLFLDKLEKIVGDRFYIVPQAHLSMFLSERMKGQNWRAAFFKINGKSVDFLLCEKGTSRPVMAIELDDYTHHMTDRIERDELVEELCKNAGMPLFRFKNGEWNDEKAIYNKIANSFQQAVALEPHE